MKHQVDQSQFKKWLIIGGISFFIFSVVIPTRYLFDVENVSVVLSILAIPVAYSIFQVLYIVKNRNLQTFTDILNFLNPEKKFKSSFFKEMGIVFSLFIVAWLIFFAGAVVSALLFFNK